MEKVRKKNSLYVRMNEFNIAATSTMHTTHTQKNMKQEWDFIFNSPSRFDS